jgi:hypothetical protein
MRTSEQINEITSALIVFHDEVNSIPKSADNPFYKSKYVPLDKILSGIQEPLKKANLSFVQFPHGENELTTRIIHTSGQWMEDTFYMKPVKSDPQAYGSVITYQRRYALSAILGLNTDEDDDGNKASEGVKQGGVKKNTKLEPGTERWEKAVKYLSGDGTIDFIQKNYTITPEHLEQLKAEVIS